VKSVGKLNALCLQAINAPCQLVAWPIGWGLEI